MPTLCSTVCGSIPVPCPSSAQASGRHKTQAPPLQEEQPDQCHRGCDVKPPPPHPREVVPDAPADLADLCHALLAKDPARRADRSAKKPTI